MVSAVALLNVTKPLCNKKSNLRYHGFAASKVNIDHSKDQELVLLQCFMVLSPPSNEMLNSKEMLTSLMAMSLVLLDVKPSDVETDMQKLEEAVKSVQMEGLTWGASKLVPVGFGMKKLQILMTIVDDLVSVDAIIEDKLTHEPINEHFNQVIHYNIKPIPQRQFRAFPGDLSLGILFPGDLSSGNVRWGTLARDSFPSDSPQRNVNSAAILHEVLNEMEKLDLE
nr:elongation factor 1-delta [Tanacetum cinerariifolium]